MSGSCFGAPEDAQTFTTPSSGRVVASEVFDGVAPSTQQSVVNDARSDGITFDLNMAPDFGDDDLFL